MMKESDFLIATLKEWCEKFDGIRVRYAYDVVSEYHIVEIEPESIRRGNEQYKSAEFTLWTAFMEKYPNADLLICEPSDANDMTNCLFDSAQMVSVIWEPFWSESIYVSSVLSLSKRSAYSKFNEYDNNKYEYALAA